MNFEFLGECKPEDEKLSVIYQEIYHRLALAEKCYWEEPQECGILLRKAAEQICRVYNMRYDIGFAEETTLKGFLCYTGEDEQNALVSRFLSAVRREQRDYLNKIRALGDDCIAGKDGPDLGMTFEDRMAQNAKRMMDAMMEVAKEFYKKSGGKNNLEGLSFSEDALPVQKPIQEEIEEETALQEKKDTLFGKLWGKRTSREFV